jgi:hypothetical protein
LENLQQLFFELFFDDFSLGLPLLEAVFTERRMAFGDWIVKREGFVPHMSATVNARVGVFEAAATEGHDFLASRLATLRSIAA